jgi:predicted RNase H-like HicB family nuclease
MSRAITKVRFSAIVIKTDNGYSARPVELPIGDGFSSQGYSLDFQGKTQREALKKLKEAAAQWLEWRADEGNLAGLLGELGFKGAIGSDTAEVYVSATEDISLSLPKNWLRKKDGAERQDGHALN